MAIKPLKLSRLPGASLIIVIAGSQFAAAAEWRFCIAPSNQEHKIYVTAPTLTGATMEALENGFHAALDRSGRRYDSVQCPTGANEQAVRAMRQHADDFNRQMGHEPVLQYDKDLIHRPSHGRQPGNRRFRSSAGRNACGLPATK